MVGQRGQVLGQAPGLVAEQPRRGPGQVGVEQVDLTCAVGGQDREAAGLRLAHGGSGIGLDREGQVEQAPDGGAHGLGVVGVDGLPGQHDRVGARRVRRTDDGAGVAGVADVGAHGQQPGRGPHDVLERRVEVAAHGHHTGRGHRVGERREGTVVDQRDRRCGEQLGVLLERERGREDLDDAPGDGQRTLDGLRAVSEEEPPLGAYRAAAQLASLLDAGVPDRQWSAHAWLQAETLGALTSSGSAALAASTSAAKAGASLTASSARILRSTSMPARPRPWMKRL